MIQNGLNGPKKSKVAPNNPNGLTVVLDQKLIVDLGRPFKIGNKMSAKILMIRY